MSARAAGLQRAVRGRIDWRFSLSQKVAPIGGRLHSSVGRGVTNPSFIEQFGFLASTFVPDPNLVPESSIGWDAGWEQTFWNGRVVVDVTYFNSRLEHEIVLASLPLQELGANLDRHLDARRRRSRRQVQAGRLADACRHLHLHGRARRQGHAGNPPAEARGVGHRDGAVRRGTRQGDAQRRLQRQDARHDLHVPDVDDDARRLHAGRRQISYDTTPWSTIYCAPRTCSMRYEEVFSYRSPGAAVMRG